jgi:hypothetical protein
MQNQNNFLSKIYLMLNLFSFLEKIRSNARPALAQQSYRRLDAVPTPERRFVADATAYKYKPEAKPKKKLIGGRPNSAVIPLRILLPTRMNGMPSVLAHFQYPYLYRPV